jgi:hypothetical protein
MIEVVEADCRDGPRDMPETTLARRPLDDTWAKKSVVTDSASQARLPIVGRAIW